MGITELQGRGAENAFSIESLGRRSGNEREKSRSLTAGSLPGRNGASILSNVGSSAGRPGSFFEISGVQVAVAALVIE
jgi:hypothetical protein